MSSELKYAEQWDISAKYFYDNKYYSWMADELNGYRTVLEIGCGTGYSTLALLEKGYNVIAVDKNSNCLNKSKILLSEKGYQKDKVSFLEGDIVDNSFRDELIKKYDFDVVICWNVGSYWSQEMLNYYLPYMFDYGLNKRQILSNVESSYSELIIWNTCRLAKAKGVAAHIIDRGSKVIDKHTDSYYHELKDEFKFLEIEYDNKKAQSVSGGGRMLTTKGVVNSEPKVNIVFVSVMYK